MIYARFFLCALLIDLIGVSSSSPASAQGLDHAVRYFDEGNIRYREGDYRGAVTSYERAAEEGFVSGALFFNMGNAYYRLDETGQAIRYYEKAAEILPRTAELEHNLAIVRAETVDQFSRLPDPFWRPWWQAVVDRFGTTALFGIGMIFYLVATVVLARRIRSGQTPWRRRILAVSATLALVFLVAGFTASVEAQTAKRAVVLIDEVTLLDAPEGARSDVDIHEGLVLDVLDDRDGWMEVRLPNGATGWIRSHALGLI